MGTRQLRLPAAVLLAAAVAGCGGPPKLTPDEDYKVATYREAFDATVLDGSEYGRTLNGVDYLIALCRRKPTAVYTAGRGKLTMRQVVEDAANTLQQYRPELAAQLDRVARNKCQ